MLDLCQSDLKRGVTRQVQPVQYPSDVVLVEVFEGITEMADNSTTSLHLAINGVR